MDNYWDDKKIVKRFFDKVEKGDNCWNWTANCDKGGYGRFTINRKNNLAHRVSFEITNKKFITDEMCILHKCDNRKCINPEHLLEGTHQDNMIDKVNKNRQARNKGELAGPSKLLEQQVLEIRQKYSNGNYSQKELANEYNIKQQTVSQIVNNKKWSHI